MSFVAFVLWCEFYGIHFVAFELCGMNSVCELCGIHFCGLNVSFVAWHGFCGVSTMVRTLSSHFVGFTLCVLWGLLCGVSSRGSFFVHFSWGSFCVLCGVCSICVNSRGFVLWFEF